MLNFSILSNLVVLEMQEDAAISNSTSRSFKEPKRCIK